MRNFLRQQKKISSVFNSTKNFLFWIFYHDCLLYLTTHIHQLLSEWRYFFYYIAFKHFFALLDSIPLVFLIFKKKLFLPFKKIYFPHIYEFLVVYEFTAAFFGNFSEKKGLSWRLFDVKDICKKHPVLQFETNSIFFIRNSDRRIFSWWSSSSFMTLLWWDFKECF